MKKFIDQRALNYDLIFFYHIRSAQYLPKNYYGKTIIEMGDLYSDNYKQTFDNLSLLGLLIKFFSNPIVVFLSKPVRNNFRISDLKLQVYFATNSELFRISFGRGVKHKILSILFKGFL